MAQCLRSMSVSLPSARLMCPGLPSTQRGAGARWSYHYTLLGAGDVVVCEMDSIPVFKEDEW